jgi:sugar transferase (PEP-CTERM system associated)
MSVRFLGVVWHLPMVVLAACLGATFIGSTYLVSAWLGPDGIASGRVASFAVLFAFLGLATVWALGLFSARQRAGLAGMSFRTLAGALIAGVLGYLLSRISSIGEIEGRTIVLITVTGALLGSIIVALVRRVIDEDVFRRRVLVYGAGVRALSLMSLRRRSDQRGFKLLGFVQLADEDVEVPADRLVKRAGSMLDIARELEVDEIVVAMDDRRRNFPIAELLQCRLSGVDITDLVTFLERETGKVHLDVLNPSWLIFGEGFRRDTLRRVEERIFDVVSSSLLLVLTSPVLLLTALAIWVDSGFQGPIFYRQVRVGYAGRNFEVIKFRSMRVNAEKNGAVWAQAGDTRVTRIGGILRKLRIDELPQIVNVLKGDMSFVGPRPERPEFVAQLAETIPYYSERHWVKPGITGWAQLCYPYGASEKDAVEKLQYDLYYVKNHSLLFDIMVLAQTVEVVLLGKGAR